MVKPPAEPTREEQLQNQLSQQLNLPGLQDSSAAVDPKPQPPEGKVRICFLPHARQPILNLNFILTNIEAGVVVKNGEHPVTFISHRSSHALVASSIDYKN